MARNAFYSFHYNGDNKRAAQVRNIGMIAGERHCHDNDWESVRNHDEGTIEKWIKGQLEGKSTTIVLIGSETAGRKWINYEIVESWNKGMALLGIYVHNITDWEGRRAVKGNNPFDHVTLKSNGAKLSTIVPVYDPPVANAYSYLADNLGAMIAHAHNVRKAA